MSDHEGIDDVTEAYRATDNWIEPILESNRHKIADLSDWFTVGCGLLTAEVPGQIRPADQYLTGWSRDFFTVLAG